MYIRIHNSIPLNDTPVVFISYSVSIRRRCGLSCGIMRTTHYLDCAQVVHEYSKACIKYNDLPTEPRNHHQQHLTNTVVVNSTHFKKSE